MRVLFGCLLLAAVGCSTMEQSAGGEITIAMVPASAEAPATVRVRGLSSSELAAVTAAADRAGWPSILRVTVHGTDVPIVGRYGVTGGALEFRPTFPFDPGRSYVVRFDSTHLTSPRQPAVPDAIVSLPGVPRADPVVVTAIHPSADVWPENTLRFYVHFSGPMSSATGVGRIHLVGDDGEDIPNALLPLNVELWNEDRTRYTVLFDPARVKRGIRQNREMGRALVQGRRYAIVVDADWRDASGRPLASAARHEFTAGPPMEKALDTRTWKIQSPAAGTMTTLVVTFPSPLDHALLARALRVMSGGEPVAGTVEIARHDMEWRFVADRPWPAGSYALVALAVLEDPSGNRINRAFEIDPADPSAHSDVEEWSVPFDVR